MKSVYTDDITSNFLNTVFRNVYPFLNISFISFGSFFVVMNASNCWAMMAILFTFIWSLLGLKSFIYRLRALTVFAWEFSARDFNFRLICFHFSSDAAYLSLHVSNAKEKQMAEIHMSVIIIHLIWCRFYELRLIPFLGNSLINYQKNFTT